MMQSLVNGGLVQGLNDRNSTMLMWVTQNYGGSSTMQQTYDYFTGYFGAGYPGYYSGRSLTIPREYYGMIGIINLRTGKLDAYSGDPVPTVQQLLSFADQANK